MGHYLNPEPVQRIGKAQQLIDQHGAEKCSRLLQMADIPEGKMAICVVENGPFDAALVAYKQGELDKITYAVQNHDLRPMTWLLMDTDKVLAINPNVPTDQAD